MVEINLKGRHALVTGGSRGIGAGICRIFAECGADVAFTYRSSEEAARILLKELDLQNGRHLAIKAPADDVHGMEQAVAEAAERMGGIDILVANVAFAQDKTLAELSIEEWQKGIDANLNTAYTAIKLAYPYLNQVQRGEILMIGSSAAYDGGGGAAYYAASKAGMTGLMKYLVRDLSPRIRVNMIHPCLVDTDGLRARHKTAERMGELEAQIPLGRLSRTTDVAYLAAFLCSDLGEFITGQSILVDGGRTLWKKSKR